MKSTLKDVSIVIVTYKGDELTRNCIDSLAATCGDDPQIVVVDNSPSEATRLMVASYPNTTYVSSPGNPGFAGGNNRAMPECNRPYVLLLNNDTIVHTRESIERLVEFLDDHPKCGAAQGSGTLKDGKRLAGCGSFLMPFGFMWSPGFAQAEEPTFDKTHPCFTVSGFFMMFRRSILPSVGGMLFRSHFWCYYEESDFCHRAWLAGHEVWYVKTPPITHLCGATASGFRRADIMSRYLRNVLFSLSANLSFWSRLYMLTACKVLLACHGAYHLAMGHAETAKADWHALASTRRNRIKIIAARRQVKKLRKASDRQLFKTIMRMPSFAHFAKYVISNA